MKVSKKTELINYLIKTNDATNWSGLTEELKIIIKNMPANEIIEAMEDTVKIRNNLNKTSLGRELN